MGPHTARAFASGGPQGVLRVGCKATLPVAAMTAAFCGLVLVAGQTIILWLYGPEYAGLQTTIALMGLAVFASSLGIVPHHGLCAIERPDMNFAAYLLGLLTMLIVTAVSMPSWPLPGAACGLLVGNIVASVARWRAFSRLARAACCGGETR